MKVAVIGAGIAGLACAWLLRDRREVRLFERAPAPGGHSKTVEVEGPRGPIAVDVGFIVYNERTYPNLIALFDRLGVATEPSDMSFSVSLDHGGFEWSGGSFGAVFAQKRNLLRPSFWRMLADIRTFNARASRWLDDQESADVSLGAWLEERGYSRAFRERYLLPMAAAIWSAPAARIEGFSAKMFFAFFANHGLLTIADQPPWRTVSGGSIRYVDAIARDLGARLETGAEVVAARREGDGVVLSIRGREEERFDRVVFACHADQALAIARDLDPRERELLEGFPYQPNRAALHGDPSMMPRRRAAWASWNALGGAREAPTRLTYWMNRLQNLSEETPLFVTLNPDRDPDRLYGAFDFAHPSFDGETPARQAAMAEIQGRGGYWWAGAWLGYGFHEDGLVSAMRVARALGAPAPWPNDVAPFERERVAA